MLIKSLYRYVFGKWEDLSEDEIKAIPEFFKSVTNYKTHKTLSAALMQLNATALYQTLYSKIYLDASYNLASDSTIMSALHGMEEQFHYGDVDATAWFETYKVYYRLCELVSQLFNNDDDPALQAYKLLVVYGGENNIEHALDLFDKDCQENNVNIAKKGISQGLAFALRESKTQQTLNLDEWRRITQEGRRDENMKLFYIACEIELSQGAMPGNIKEALQAARAIDYAKRASFPKFAGLCESAFVPETFFDACLQSDKEKRMDARKYILALLPQQKRVDFINSLPNIGFDFTEINALLKCLREEEHLIFIERFKQEIGVCIKQLDDLCSLLNSITLAKPQGVLLLMLSTSLVSSLIQELSELDFLIEKIHPDTCYEFLFSVVGCEKINALIKNGNDRENLLTVLSLVNETHRLKLIEEVIGIVHVRTAIEGFFYKDAKQKILALLPVDDRQLFLQILPSATEKLVLQAKQKIVNTTFPVGVMGMGMSGCDIVLDNGKKKTVPNTVAEIWKIIQSVEKRTVSPENGWDKMQLLALSKANQKASTLTYLSQSNETIDFYKSFEVVEKKTSVKRCNV